MAKQHRSIRQTKVARQGNIGHQLEHTEVFDDNLLPDASEIEKLQALDPNIVEWLKSRAEKEQDFRQEAYKKKLDVIQKTESKVYRINMVGLIFAFIFLILGLFTSVYLIGNNHEVTGSIFTGFTLLLGGSLLANRSIFSRKDIKNNLTGPPSKN